MASISTSRATSGREGERLNVIPDHGGIDQPPPGDGGDDGGGRQEPEQTPPVEGYRIGIGLALISITAMFMALSVAYFYNRAHAGRLEFPTIFLLSTALILMSSATIERARALTRKRREEGAVRWLGVTLIIGLAFLSAQIGAWRQLVASGFYVNTNHHSSYAYIFTALHAAHLGGGLLALVYLIRRASRGLGTSLRRRVSLDVTALYWHFLAALWLYLLALLFLWNYR